MSVAEDSIDWDAMAAEQRPLVRAGLERCLVVLDRAVAGEDGWEERWELDFEEVLVESPPEVLDFMDAWFRSRSAR